MFRYIEVRQKKKKKDYKIPAQMPASPPGEREMDNFTHDGGIRKEERGRGRGGGRGRDTPDKIGNGKNENNRESVLPSLYNIVTFPRR